MFNRRGFASPFLLILLLIIIGLSLYVNQYKNKITLVKQPITSPSPSMAATPSATTVAPLSPTPTISKSLVASFDCILNSSADRVPPPATFYFTTNPAKSDLGQIALVDWDINGDGIIDNTSTTAEYSYTFKDIGDYNVKARIRLANGSISNWCSRRVEARYHDVKCNIYPSPSSGKAPLKVFLNTGVFSDAQLDSTGLEARQWDFNGDGNWDTSFNIENAAPTYTYNEAKTYTVRLQVKTKSGRLSEVCSAQINVTN